MPQTNILILGDAFIPIRAARIPAMLKEKIQPEKINSIITTGNLTSSHVFEYLKTVSTDILAVLSPLDDATGSETASKTYGADESRFQERNGIKFGAVNGFQVVPPSDSTQLTKFAAMLDVDVLCASGELLIEEQSERIIVRPGSLTGVYGYPSFVIASTDGKKIKFTTYVLKEGQVVVEEYLIKKQFREDSEVEVSQDAKEEVENSDEEKIVVKKSKDKKKKKEESDDDSEAEKPKKKKRSAEESSEELVQKKKKSGDDKKKKDKKKKEDSDYDYDMDK